MGSETELDGVIGELGNQQKMKLMEIFSTTPLQTLLDDFSTPKNVELLLPFTDRYRRRIDNLRIQSRFSNFLLESIKPAIKMDEIGGTVGESDEEMMEQETV